MTARRVLASTVVAGLTVAALTTPGTASAAQQQYPDRKLNFDRTATYPVFQNRPEGEDPATATVAEISAVSPRTAVPWSTPTRWPGGSASSTSARAGPAARPRHPLPGPARRRRGRADLGGDRRPVRAGRGEHQRQLHRPVRSPRRDRAGHPAAGRAASTSAGSPTPSRSATTSGTRRSPSRTSATRRPPRPAARRATCPRRPPASCRSSTSTGKATPQRWKLRTVRADRRRRAARCPRWPPPGSPSPPTRNPSTSRSTSRNQLAVTLQENNGVVLVDLPTGRITRCLQRRHRLGQRHRHEVRTVGIDLTGVDHRRAPRARRGGLGRRPLPGHRQRGRLAGRHPWLVDLRQPHRPGGLGRRQHLRAARRPLRAAQQGPGREEGHRAGGRGRRRVRRRAVRVRRLGAEQLRRRLRPQPARPRRCCARYCPPPTARRGCCPSRPAACSRSPARRTTPRWTSAPRCRSTGSAWGAGLPEHRLG